MAAKKGKTLTEVKTKNPLSSGSFDEKAAREAMKLIKEKKIQIVDLKFDTLLKMGGDLLLYKYIIKNMAKKNNMVATFMPKPLFADNGSGMH